MSRRDYLVQVPRSGIDGLARLRAVNDLFVFDTDEFLWVKSTDENKAKVLLMSLQGRHFRIDEQNKLYAGNDLLASGRLPNPRWIPIREWLSFSPPPSKWPGHHKEDARLTLAVSDNVRECFGMLTTIEALSAFAESTLELRFQHLKFAMKTDKKIFIRGTPLPPIPGRRFQIIDDIAVPAGLCWTPAVDASTVRQAFGSPEGTILWQESFHWELIPNDDFTAVTRSAVRASRDTV